MGAIQPLMEGMEKRYFDGYDWIVRLNPEVLIKDDAWLWAQMADPQTNALVVWCTRGRIHTDFTAFRVSALEPHRFMLNTSQLSKAHNAETHMTEALANILSNAENYANVTENNTKECRVSNSSSPVVHVNELLHQCPDYFKNA